MKRAYLGWKAANLIVEEVHGLEFGAHANLGGQLGDEVVGGVQVPQVTQPANLSRKIRQSVGCDVELLQELVGEQRRSQDTQPLTAHVEVVPVLPLVRLLQAPRSSPVLLSIDRGPGITTGQSSAADAPILGRLKPCIEVRLVLLSHSGMRPFGLLVQSQLLCPVLGERLRLSAAGGPGRVPVLQVARREGAGVGQDAAREGRVAHDPRTAMVLLDALVVLGVRLVWVARLLLKVVEHGHGLLPARSSIDAGIVPLLVVLAVHAA